MGYMVGVFILGGECFFLNQLLGVLCRSGGYRRAVWELVLESVRQDSVTSRPLLQHQTNHPETDRCFTVVARKNATELRLAAACSIQIWTI